MRKISLQKSLGFSSWYMKEKEKKERLNLVFSSLFLFLSAFAVSAILFSF